MGAGLAVLILLLASVAGAGMPVHGAPPSRCLSCHPVHYADRGGCAVCHRGNERTSRPELAHAGLIKGRYAVFTGPDNQEVAQGNRLSDRSGCRRCHVMKRTGNRLASDLDGLFWSSTPAQIDAALTDPTLFMPEFQFSQHDRDLLIIAILAAGYHVTPAATQPPQIVHFADQPTRTATVFEQKCGGCHKLLSARNGGLGGGSAGPNLSGLLTRYYPASFTGRQVWTEQRLKRWLANPRRIRPFAGMRPVPLKPDEFAQLYRILAPTD